MAKKTALCTPLPFWKHNNSLFLFTWRVFQMIGAIAVLVYYAHDLNKARKQKKYADSKWVRPHKYSPGMAIDMIRSSQW
jgi:hypothetical protein